MRVAVLQGPSAPTPSADARIIIARISMDRAFLDELRRIVGDDGLLQEPLELLTYEC